MPPRQPVQQRARITVDAIVEAAFICVAERGMAGTTTRHIATRAGIGIASLYEYFANKEEVYAAMNRKMVEDVIDLIRPMVPQLVKLDIASAIKTMLHAFGELLQRHEGRYLHCARESIRAQMSTDLHPIGSVLRELIMQYIMQHPRFMRLPNVATMGYIFIHGGMFTLLHYLSDPNPPIAYEALVDGLAQMVAHHAEYELMLQAGQAG
jgi:AcrR family transcriptional regulator